ncbi:MAG: hypothetical protein ABR541_08070 [Candidatus Dormibacteria bacterium]
MEPVRFADGFDGPDRVAFGLSSGALGVVAAGLALGYLILHSPLPGPVAVAVAVLIVAVAAAVGWGSWAGRSALAWAVAAGRFVAGPETMSIGLEQVTGDSATADRALGETLSPATASRHRADGTAALGTGGGTDATSAADGQPEDPVPGTGGGAAPADPPLWARWLEPLAETGHPTAAPAPVASPSRADAPAAPPRHAAPGPAERTPGHGADPVTTLTDPEDGDADADDPLPAGRPHLDDEVIAWLHRRVRGPVRPTADESAVSSPPETSLVVLPGAATGQEQRSDVKELELPGRFPRFPAATGAIPGRRRRARRVAFFALNGGVGRTTLAVEVAAVLAARGRRLTGPPGRLRVAYVDLDPRSSTACLRLGMPLPPREGFAGLADGPVAHAEHSSGLIALVDSSPRTSFEDGLSPAGAAAQVHRLEADGVEVVVLDCDGRPPELATWVLETADDIYLVLSDSARGVQDAYRATADLRRLGFAEKLAYVVNQATGRVDFGPTMADLRGSLLASIPHDDEIADAEDFHRIASLEGSGPGAVALRRLAGSIHPLLEEGSPGQPLDDRQLRVRPAVGAG